MNLPTEEEDVQTTNFQVNDKVFAMLDRPEGTIALWGGSASGKTYTAIQWAVSQLITPHPEYGVEGWRCYLCRRYRTQAESDLWDPLLKQLVAFGVAKQCRINEARLTVRYTPEGTTTENMIHVRGLDGEEKVKSMPGVWIIDEANQITEDTYDQLTNRTGRAFGTQSKVVLMWNPVSKSSWLYKRFFAEPGRDPDFVDLHLTYRDNIWNLSPSYVVRLECNYKGRMRDIYTLGNWGTSEGLIYSEDQWRVEDVPEDILQRRPYDCIGIDWGTNHPTAVVGITIQDPSPATDMRLLVLVDELYYKAGNQAIANVKDHLLSLNLPPMPIYCDSARPESINDLRSVGLDARKATKHVFDGLTYMQGCFFLITSRSTNVIREIENYQWDKSPEGVWLDEPLKEWDHAMDAMRYAVYTYHQEMKAFAAMPKLYLNSERGLWAS